MAVAFARRAAAVAEDAGSLCPRSQRQCLVPFSANTGARAGVAGKAFAALEASDVRAFMAMRRADDIGGRSLMRALWRACARSDGSWNAKARARSARLSAIRAPKIGKSLPKPIQMAAAKRLADADERAGEDRDPWIWARDAAVMALLYGSGLRISEALGLKHRDVPKPGEGDVHHRDRQGQQDTDGAGAAKRTGADFETYAAMCPHPLPPAGPMFVGARGGPAAAPALSSSPWSGCAARSACPTAPRRMRCGIPSPPIC